MLTASLVCAGILAFWAGIINEENASSLLSGYNTMSDKKKKNVDFKGIAQLYRKVFYAIAAVLALIGILSYFFENERLWTALLILTMAWGLLPLFFLGKQYDPNTYSKTQRILNYFVMCLLFFGGFALATMFYLT